MKENPSKRKSDYHDAQVFEDGVALKQSKKAVDHDVGITISNGVGDEGCGSQGLHA